ncbi:hypothetical protein [Streptomyces chartreusis]|uniref:hypothetical protein n=1 Tax=Streptomyces chartreusis TaxID=1969 RepID=UPI0034297232
MPTLVLRRVPAGTLERRPHLVPALLPTGLPKDNRRQGRIARTVLCGILAVQVLLTLRRSTAVNSFEALSFTVGHAEVTELFEGALGPLSVPALAGAPQSYPVLGAVAHFVGGIQAARTASLICMLVATTLLCGLTTRLFNVPAGLCAASLFAVLPSTAVLGGTASPEAAGLCLLACAARSLADADRAVRSAALCTLPSAAAAALTQHWTVLCLPAVLLLAARTGSGGRAIARILGLGLCVAGLLGTLYGSGLRLRPVFPLAGQGDGSSLQGADPATALLIASAVLGAACYLVSDGRGEDSSTNRLLQGYARRAVVVLALSGAAAAPFAGAWWSGTSAYGFGPAGGLAWFASALAGVGVTRAMGRHFSFPQAGIAVWTVLLCLGLPQTDRWFATDPDPAHLGDVLTPYGRSTGIYMGIPAEVAAYHLRGTVRPEQWTDCAGRINAAHVSASVDEAGTCAQAVRRGEFRLIVLDSRTRPSVQKAVRAALHGNPHYRLLAELTSRQHADGTAVGVRYRIWVQV